MAVWQIQLKERGAYGLISLSDVLFRKEMPDLFSLDQIIAIIGAAAAVVITAVAKASDSILAWLKFKKNKKIEPSQLLAE